MLARRESIKRRSGITARRGSNLPNLDDETPDVDEAGRWMIVINAEILFGFVSEKDAREAFAAMSKAFVPTDGVEMILQERDENGNWLTIDTGFIP
jgi:hypothetical protein